MGLVLEFLPGRFVAFHLGQAGNAVALQTAVQGRACQVRDGRLERIEAVIQGQQAVLAERQPLVPRTTHWSAAAWGLWASR